MYCLNREGGIIKTNFPLNLVSIGLSQESLLGGNRLAFVLDYMADFSLEYSSREQGTLLSPDCSDKEQCDDRKEGKDKTYKTECDSKYGD